MHRAPWPLIAPLVLALAFALAGCRPPAERADPRRPIAVTLLSPARVGAAVVEVRASVDGVPASGASIRLVGDMTHAGMIPIVAAGMREVEAGRYESEGFLFDMAGDWVLTAEVTFADGVRRSAALPVAVGR
jgi:hypothetical protein